MGHSMGGHGALTIGLKNAAAFKSISAFSPIVNPVNVPWGKKAFTGYLGEDEASWKVWLWRHIHTEIRVPVPVPWGVEPSSLGHEYDACELIKGFTGAKLPILVDQ
eukprot:98038-Pyramimonas_sp.AAC.1